MERTIIATHILSLILPLMDEQWVLNFSSHNLPHFNPPRSEVNIEIQTGEVKVASQFLSNAFKERMSLRFAKEGVRLRSFYQYPAEGHQGTILDPGTVETEYQYADPDFEAKLIASVTTILNRPKRPEEE